MSDTNNPKSKIQNLKPACIRVPASSGNLGAGFDCLGVALKLYLEVEAYVDDELQMPCSVEIVSSENPSLIALDEKNLIYRTMKLTAEQFDKSLPKVHLKIKNGLPLSAGLGSSAAAIIAGINLANQICELNLSKEEMLGIATEIEGHPDNAAPSIFGGWIVSCVDEKGKPISIKRPFPDEIKVLVVTPHTQLETKKARAALPVTVSHNDAVFNLQRSALFVAAIESRRFDLLREAMRDRLHQPYRENLIPGLRDALAVEGIEGLLGIALSGAGPSVLAFATENFDAIGERIASCFNKKGIETTVRLLEVENEGI